MAKPEFPQRSCLQPVWGQNDAAYLCELPDLHPGPCSSDSVQASVERRAKWEAANPDWKDNIGDETTWT